MMPVGTESFFVWSPTKVISFDGEATCSRNMK